MKNLLLFTLIQNNLLLKYVCNIIHLYIYMYTFDDVDLIAVKNACIHIPLT